MVPLPFLVDEDIVVLPKKGTAVPTRKSLSVTASGSTMPIGWTAPTVHQMGDDQGLRTLVVVAAEGTGLERNHRLLGFVLCRVVRQGGQPISANRFPRRRAVNACMGTCTSRRLSHDGDGRGGRAGGGRLLGGSRSDIRVASVAAVLDLLAAQLKLAPARPVPET